MKRISIRHDGTMYSVGQRDLADLQQEIVTALKSGEPYWLEVNEGEGMPRPALILVTPGMNLTLIPLPEPHLSPEDTSTTSSAPPQAR
jgi:hypothetical protein